jgi:hypothetical protein
MVGGLGDSGHAIVGHPGLMNSMKPTASILFKAGAMAEFE